MRTVDESLQRVMRLEAMLEDDRRELVRAASVLTGHAMNYLSRPHTLAICYAVGTLVGATAADVGRRFLDAAQKIAAARAQSARAQSAPFGNARSAPLRDPQSAALRR